MILIEIRVPFLGKTWDAKVEEKKTVRQVIRELTACLGDQQEENLVNYMLVWPERQWILQEEHTLEYYGIQSGEALMLV